MLYQCNWIGSFRWEGSGYAQSMADADAWRTWHLIILVFPLGGAIVSVLFSVRLTPVEGCLWCFTNPCVTFTNSALQYIQVLRCLCVFWCNPDIMRHGKASGYLQFLSCLNSRLCRNGMDELEVAEPRRWTLFILIKSYLHTGILHQKSSCEANGYNFAI